MTAREPVLRPVAIEDLKPTQITVGYREVNEKRKKIREQDEKECAAFLGRHMIPTVLGPRERHYVIDNHHLARALQEEGIKEVLVSVTADLSALPKIAFWRFLDNRNWCHTYDAEGKRVAFDDIPGSIDKLKDDPYRSLAGDLRHAGGFAKDITPFSEFLWADFLRRKIKPKAVKSDYEAALTRALALAKGREAAYLPGWCGPDPIA